MFVLLCVHNVELSVMAQGRETDRKVHKIWEQVQRQNKKTCVSLFWLKVFKTFETLQKLVARYGKLAKFCDRGQVDKTRGEFVFSQAQLHRATTTRRRVGSM